VGFMSDIWGSSWNSDPFSRGPKNRTRRPTADDRIGWDTALDQQPRGQQRTIETVRKQIRFKNPIRWIQLEHDIKWVQKEMKKLGLNPEDWRSLL
jgi:hypothetical protein